MTAELISTAKRDEERKLRTYRGRTLEELLPKIRAELGPNAIIVRQREGLIGGVGGFFAQRCIEVDARRGEPLVDIYDEEDAGELAATPAPARPDRDRHPTPVAAPMSPTAEGPVPADEFMRRLEQAAAAWREEADEEPAGAAEPDAVEEPLAASEPVAITPRELEPGRATEVSAGTDPIDEPETIAEPQAPSGNLLPVLAGEPQAQLGRSRRLRARRGKRAGERPQATAALPAARPSIPSSATGDQAAAAIARELAARGAGSGWITQLLAEAASHRSPLARGGLREGVRRAIARGLTTPARLPAGGAAIAFAGPGGSGKSRCTAALAAAYKRGSVLTPAVLALGASDRGRMHAALLKADDVAVKAPQNAEATLKLLARLRAGGLAILDTPAVAPGDHAAIRALAAELEPAALDALYITLPATLGTRPAAAVLAGLARLRPAGIAITHADETDQLAVAIEHAWSTRLPVAFLHAGTDLRSALSAPEPLELAHMLLP